MRHLSNPDHPVHRFGMGNMETLWTGPHKQGIDVRRELLRFHDRFYSANLMKLSVMGFETLDQMTDMVVSKFSAIPNKHIPRPCFRPDSILPSDLGTIVHYKPINDICTLRLFVSVPYLKPYWRSQPGPFLSHFLGHEGPGSILAHLRRRDWCFNAAASVFGGSVGFDFLHLNFFLTPQGLLHWGEVVASVFDYAELMRELVEQNDGTFPQWMFDEQKQLSELSFDFSTPVGPAYTTMIRASSLHNDIPPEYTLADRKYREMNSPALRAILDHVRPSQARVYLASQSLPPELAYGHNPLPLPTEQESIFGTEYSLTHFPAWLFDPSRPRTPGLALPKPNPFIPRNLRRSPPQTRLLDTSTPVLLSQSDRVRLWYQPDLQACEPKVNVWLRLLYAPPTVTAHDKVVLRVFLSALRTNIAEHLYDASLAGLQFTPQAGSGWTEIFVTGFRNNLGNILQFIIERIKTFVPDHDLLANLLDRYRSAWSSFGNNAPFAALNTYLAWFFHDDAWLPPALIGALDQIRVADVVKFRDEMLQRASMDLYINGNCGESDALTVRDMMEQYLPPWDAGVQQTPQRPYSLLLDARTDTLFCLPLVDPEEVNSAVLWYAQMGEATRADLGVHAALELLVGVAQQPVFDELRTNQQLGYHVSVNSCVHSNSLGFSIQLQSEYQPRGVRKRIEHFLCDKLAPLLRNMTPETFAARRSALASQTLSSAATTPWLQIQKVRETISNNTFDFKHAQHLAAAIQATSLADLQRLFFTYVHPESPYRSKLVIELESAQAKTLRSRRSRRARASRARGSSEPMGLTGPETEIRTAAETGTGTGHREVVPQTTVHSLAEALALRGRLRRSRPAQPVRPWSEYAPRPV